MNPGTAFNPGIPSYMRVCQQCQLVQHTDLAMQPCLWKADDSCSGGGLAGQLMHVGVFYTYMPICTLPDKTHAE